VTRRFRQQLPPERQRIPARRRGQFIQEALIGKAGSYTERHQLTGTGVFIMQYSTRRFGTW
jgi:hypothetical protein